MGSNTYTEEEFKKVLKTVFTEKKRVKELQKKLEERGVQKKFGAKLSQMHNQSLSEEMAKLQERHAEKELECQQLSEKLDKVRPALKRLVEDLKQAREEVEILKTPQGNAFVQEVEAQLAKVEAREKQESARFEAERSKLVERLAEELSQIQRQTEVIKELREQVSHYTNLQHKFEEEAAQKHQIEQRLWQVEEQLGEAHKQLQASDVGSVRAEYEQKFKEEQERHEALVAHLNQEILAARAERDKAKGEYSDLTEQFHEALDEKERGLEKSYAKMRELSSRHAEMVEELEKLSQDVEARKEKYVRLEKELAVVQNCEQAAKLKCQEHDAEMRQAQAHLAKKVKEATILRDMAERQKEQLAELQGTVNTQKNELERLTSSLNLQQQHEQKMAEMAKERNQAAEALAKEWQDKFLALQQQTQEERTELAALQKIRDEYDQMALTVANLKNILGKGEET